MEDFVKHTKDQDDNKSEKARLSGQHEVLVDAMGGISKAVVAPLDTSKSGLRILDSGTADGRWILDLDNFLSPFGMKHTYVGTDIDSNLYPSSPPSNISFQNQSIREPFPEEWNGTFDLVHQRLVMAAAPPSTILSVVERLMGLLKPGGWLQLMEADTTGSSEEIAGNGPALKEFLRYPPLLSQAGGMGPNLARDLADTLKKAGMKNVGEEKVPSMHGAKNQNPKLKEKSIDSLCGAVPPLMMGVKMMLPHEYDEGKAGTLQARLRKELETQGGQTNILVV